MSANLTTSRNAVDMQRFRHLMAAAELDAVIAWGGANFHYMTGYQNYFDNPGGSIALLPADPAQKGMVLVASWVEESAKENISIADVRTYPLWLEIADIDEIRSGRASRQPKPSPRFDIARNMTTLAEAVNASGLGHGRIGIEMNLVSAAAFALLRARLPHATFVECGGLFTDLRAIKSPFEIACLQEATRFAEAGLLAVASTPLRGLDTQGLKMIYDNACAERAARMPDAGFMATRVTASIGVDISPTLTGGARITGNESVFFDCAASIRGYGSDTGRTLIFHPPTDEMRRIMDAVCAGMDAGIALLRPGTAMCEIFHAGQNAVRKAGLDWYTRGHIGHTIGLGMGEQAPYLSPNETRALEAGMVIALETPLYIKGLGGFQVEECFVITDTGHEKITSLPRDFITAVL
ncbi:MULTISPECIES: M24 family metallopeptidase [unclassified Brenneria]|uniref:M24 family metallopeptidase n=1 Tax=unclassified Brenneria TaxID=2634434 RepID=UPI0029C43CAC|nr:MULTISPECIES: M24 family metallopeptidase [unclassified Brenneria]MDX5627161.1 M24 family metallopeptidase [Brenneria sp. L3-3Z]MDX5694684.1 M24 family metallopeptidase [Brenneria sp. L4-2C]